MGGPAGYYTDASIAALRITGPFKPHHFIKVGIPSEGGGVIFTVILKQGFSSYLFTNWLGLLYFIYKQKESVYTGNQI
jgi:hypothetical protein